VCVRRRSLQGHSCCQLRAEPLRSPEKFQNQSCRLHQRVALRRGGNAFESPPRPGHGALGPWRGVGALCVCRRVFCVVHIRQKPTGRRFFFPKGPAPGMPGSGGRTGPHAEICRDPPPAPTGPQVPKEPALLINFRTGPRRPGAGKGFSQQPSLTSQMHAQPSL
jgi:hypothetical protein